MSKRRTSKVVRYSRDKLPPDKTDWARLDAVTDEEVLAAALSDPDAQPLTPEQIGEDAPRIARQVLRQRLGMTQAEFAEALHLPITTLHDWEQHRSTPDAPARALLLAREEDRVAAVHHARAAIAGGADDATALAIAGFIISLAEHDRATAFTMFDRALALSNTNIFALSCSALIMSFSGRTESAIERAQRALRLSPFDSFNYLAYNALAISYFVMGQYEASRDAARLSVQLNPRFSVSHLFLAAALVRLGHEEEAKCVAQRVLALDRAFTIRRFLGLVGFEPTVFMPLADAWRAADLPEA